MNPSTAKILDRALQLVVARQQWFTAEDVAQSCDFEVPIDEVTAWLNSSEPNPSLVRYSAPDPSQIDAYTTEDFLARWWIERAIRWLESGVETMTARELGSSMAATFGNGTWEVPSDTLLGAGIDLHAIACTIDDQRYAMPWSIIANLFPEVEHHLRAALSVADIPRTVDPDSISDRWDECFKDLDDRAIHVVARRFGIYGSSVKTLEEIGYELELTRERIRQIERAALVHLKQNRAHDLIGIAIEGSFAKSPIPLIVESGASGISPELRLACSMVGSKTVRLIRPLGIGVLQDSQWVHEFETALNSRDNTNHVLEARLGDDRSLNLPERVRDLLGTMPLPEAQYLSEAVKNFLNDQFDAIIRTKQVYLALEHLGTAGHYSDVAALCTKLWPTRPLNAKNAITLLQTCEKDPQYDVVWIGRKGMYALESQGFTRPDKGLYQTVEEIVREEFARTGSPVSFDTVWVRLHDYRQQPHKPSLVMALGFSKRLATVEGHRYVPAESKAATTAGDGDRTGYDFSGTF